MFHDRYIFCLHTCFIILCNVDAAHDNDNLSLESHGRSEITMLSTTVSDHSSKSSEVHVPSESSTLPILVHFEYGEDKFARKIKVVDFSGFYKSILSILEKKVPGQTPHNLKFRCGKKWYPLKENTGLDALCLDDKDAEIDVQAKPTARKSGKFSVLYIYN